MLKNNRFFIMVIMSAAVLFVTRTGLFAQAGDSTASQDVVHGPGFVDENGDGYHDNRPDHDGDGIPNGQDPDYERSGFGRGRGFQGFLDQDGDGINDRAQDFDGDGIPNGQDPDYERPQDGTGRKLGTGQGHGKGGSGRWRDRRWNPGIGPRTGQQTGTGTCDGTGPKGTGKKGR